MSFNPSIPVATDFRAVSQRQILSNFQAIASAWLENHVPLTAVDNVGKHEVLSLRFQTVDPTTAANQSAIYNKLVAGVPQLFFRPNTDQTPIQLSNSNLNTLQTGATGDAQSSFLAGPFTIYMGYIRDCPDTQLVTLLPSSTLIYVGLSTILQGTVPVGIASTATATNIAANTFIVRYNNTQITGNNATIYYTAVGV